MLLHYLYTTADGLVIYAKAGEFKANATNSRPRQTPDNPKAKAKKMALGPNINIHGSTQSCGQ